MSYTLLEIIKNNELWTVDLEVGQPVKVALEDESTETFYAHMLKKGFKSLSPSEVEPHLTDNQKSDEENILFCGYVYPTYRDLFVTDKITDALALQDLCHKMVMAISKTEAYYIPVIRYFEAKKNNLLDKIESETKFNNTPQNAQGQYDWGDDDHLTTVTKSSTDAGTMMSRLKEVQDDLENLYRNWLNEIKGMFWY